MLTFAFSKSNGKHDPTSAQRKNFRMVEFHAPSTWGGVGMGEIKQYGFVASRNSLNHIRQTVTPLLKHKGLQGSTPPLGMKSIPS